MNIEDLKIGEFYNLKKGDINYIFRYIENVWNSSYIHCDHMIDIHNSDNIEFRLSNLTQAHWLCDVKELKYIKCASAQDLKKYYNIDLTYNIKISLL